MLFLGRADKDLRCVRCRHCWDYTPEFAQINLAAYDGIKEKTDDYDVVTFSGEQIERALMETTQTDYYEKCGHPMKVELVGNGNTKVNAWLYYPTEDGNDFPSLRDKIEETYGISFPSSLADWYKDGVPFSVDKEWLFPDWLDMTENNIANIKQRINNPKEWILNDAKKGMWHNTWGEKPDDFDEAIDKLKNLLDQMPPLIPICSHRYMVCLEGNDDPPVISTVGYDTVLYGSNLKEYLSIEFGGGLFPDEAAVPNTDFWG